jgi:hypothetical protein
MLAAFAVETLLGSFPVEDFCENILLAIPDISFKSPV